MIVLDENIPEEQCALLRKWRIRFRQVGQEVGRQGMKDEQHIVPLLHKLDRPTFFTRDLDFADKRLRHRDYGLVCLGVPANDAAVFIKRFLRHSSFNSKKKRMGTIVRVSAAGLRVRRLGAEKEEQVDWAG